MLENAHFKAQNLLNSIWRPGSAWTRWESLQRSPRLLAVSKEERVGDGNEREIERKGTIRSKEKRQIKGKGGELGIMEYVFRIVEVRYWQHIDLPP